MPVSNHPPVRLLALHAGYRCRNSGVCCTEDWAIPVGRPLQARLATALENGTLRPSRQTAPLFEPAPEVEADAQAVVGRRGCECVFYEPERGRLCAIHRDLGHDHLPSACQHFPRVVTRDPRGLHLSLSHVCPTAGALLSAGIADWHRVVHDGPVVTAGLEWTGLDARDDLPPQVHASLLWDWEAMTLFEQRTLDLLARLEPLRVLSVVAAVANRLARHAGPEGSLGSAVAYAFDACEATSEAIVLDVPALAALARRCAPEGADVAGVATRRTSASRMAIERDDLAPPFSRYLAARLLASTVMYHAASVGVWSKWLQLAAAVLEDCITRQADRSGTLDRAAMLAAAADADRLLVHQIDHRHIAAALQGRHA